LYEELDWSVDTDLDMTILVWHIATHVYLSWYEANHAHRPHHLAQVTQVLSNYMMFLLADRPYMLPNNIGRHTYVELCSRVIHNLKYSSEADLLRLIQVHRGALSAGSDDDISRDHDISEMSTLERACQLGAKLISRELETPDANFLELISQVWVELLCYTAYRCIPDSHAKQLSNGGEFTTIVALLLQYAQYGILHFGGGG
jgi:hypothetical protein